MPFRLNNNLLRTYFFEYFALAISVPTLLPPKGIRSLRHPTSSSVVTLALLALMKGSRLSGKGVRLIQLPFLVFYLYAAFFLACRFLSNLQFSLCRFFFVVRMFHTPVNSNQVVTDFRYAHRWLYQRREYGIRASFGIVICFSRYYLFQFDKTLLERLDYPSIVFGSSFYATFSLLLDVLHRFSERSLLFQFLNLFSLE